MFIDNAHTIHDIDKSSQRFLLMLPLVLICFHLSFFFIVHFTFNWIIWKALSYKENERVNVNRNEWTGERMKQASERVRQAQFYFDQLKMRRVGNLCAAPRVRFSIANKTKTPIFKQRVHTWWKFHIICAVWKIWCRNEKKKSNDLKMTAIRVKIRRSKNRDRTFSKTYDSFRMPKRLIINIQVIAFTFISLCSWFSLLLHFDFSIQIQFFISIVQPQQQQQQWCSFNEFGFMCARCKMAEFCVFMGAEIETKLSAYAWHYNGMCLLSSLSSCDIFFSGELMLFFSLFMQTCAKKSNVKFVYCIHCVWLWIVCK